MGGLLAAGLPSAPLQRRLGAVPRCHGASPRAAAGFLHRVSIHSKRPDKSLFSLIWLCACSLPWPFFGGFQDKPRLPPPGAGRMPRAEARASAGSVPRDWDTQHPSAHRAPGWQRCSDVQHTCRHDSLTAMWHYNRICSVSINCYPKYHPKSFDAR